MKYFAFFVSAIVLAGAVASGSNPRSAEEQLNAIEKRAGGRLGVTAIDTGSGKRIEHRANERFAMCSTFKFLAAAAVLHRVDQKEETLEHRIPYTAADLLEYAPVTRQHVAEGSMTLRALCEAAIQYSDNTAGNLLLRTIGGPGGVNAYVRGLGDHVTHLDRIEPELNDVAPGDERDTTTPSAMINDMTRLLLGDGLSPASRDLLESWMIANTTGAQMIRAGVPKSWRVGDKTGRGARGATNDIAILRRPNAVPVLACIYLNAPNISGDARMAAVAEVAKVIAESLTQ